MSRNDGSVRAEVGNIETLEGLRGIAVLWVILFHYVVVRDGRFPDPWIALLAESGPLQPLIRNGYLGVDLFFLITGFLLTLPWWRHAAEGRAAPNTREFYLRRMRRIVPAYYVQLALLFVLFVPLLLGSDFIRRNLPFYVYNVGAHATFMHYTTPLSSASLTINGALWSLALEMQYYLLLPLLAPLFVRMPWRMAALFVAAAVGWQWLARHGLQAPVAWMMEAGAQWNPQEAHIRQFLVTQLPGYLGHFAAGILCGRAWLAWRERTPGRTAAPALALLGVVGMWWLLTERTGLLNPITRTFAILGALTMVMVGLVCRASPASRRILANKPLLFTGRVSYSAYLYHLPLLLTWNKYAPETGWLSLPVYLIAVLAVAALSYRYVEQPFMRPREERRLALGAGAIPYGERSTDRQGLQESHAPQHVGVAARVHQRPEDERRKREAGVDA